jgi:hypothetical protein
VHAALKATPAGGGDRDLNGAVTRLDDVAIASVEALPGLKAHTVRVLASGSCENRIPLS